MSSMLLMSAARPLTTLLLMFAIFLLVRGHNAPGGGFIAGLVVASAISLYALAFDVASARSLVKVHPIRLISVGLFAAIVSAIPGMFDGAAFLTGVWFKLGIGTDGVKLGTPLLFDLGVFLVVTGMAMSAILYLAEEED